MFFNNKYHKKFILLFIMLFNFQFFTACSDSPSGPPSLLNSKKDFIIPEFFSNPIEKVSFEKTIQEYWESPAVPLPENDQLRIDKTKNEVIKQAWEDYIFTSSALNAKKIILTNSSFPMNHNILADQVLQQLKEGGYLRIFLFLWRSIGREIDEKINIEPPAFNLSASDSKDLELIAANQKTIDIPLWSNSNLKGEKMYINNTLFFQPSNPPLLNHLSNTNTLSALTLIEAGADINKYSVMYGNNSLLLATAKGWNHVSATRIVSYQGEKIVQTSTFLSPGPKQRPILEELLNQPHLEINAVDLKTGMTALHLACLRGDNTEFIMKLLHKGADPSIQDYQGKTALDLTKVPYFEARDIILNYTGGHHLDLKNLVCFNDDSQPMSTTHHLITATFPNEKERENNHKEIVKILKSLN